jgi:hypothetical protein
MKIYFKILRAFLLLSLVFTLQSVSFSQGAPPPPPPQHGTAENAPPGGGAPIGEGLFFLIGLAGLYGGIKIYDIRKSLKVKEL